MRAVAAAMYAYPMLPVPEAAKGRAAIAAHVQASISRKGSGAR